VVIRSINHSKAQAVVLLVPTPTNLIIQSMFNTYPQSWGAYGLLQLQNSTVSSTYREGLTGIVTGNDGLTILIQLENGLQVVCARESR
jgi:hypothetical protein